MVRLSVITFQVIAASRGQVITSGLVNAMVAEGSKLPVLEDANTNIG